MKMSFKDEESVVAKESLRFAVDSHPHSETESTLASYLQETRHNGGDDILIVERREIISDPQYSGQT